MFSSRSDDTDTPCLINEFRHPVACGHQRRDPLDTSNRRPLPCRGHAPFDISHSPTQCRCDINATLPNTKSVSDPFDVSEDIIEDIGLKRDDPGLRTEGGTNSALDVDETNSTDVTLCLGDDYVWRQLFQQGCVHPIHRQPLLQDRFDAFVNLVTSTVQEFRFGTYRQGTYRGRVVTLVRPSNKLIFQTQHAHHFSAGRDQRHNSGFYIHRTPASTSLVEHEF